MAYASVAYADSYKCESEERIVRRDKPCQPGERELEAPHARDKHFVRPPPQSVASEGGKPAVSPATAGAQTPPDSVYAAPSTVGGGRVTGVVGTSGAMVVPDTPMPAPSFSSPSVSDPLEKQLEGFRQLAAYCQFCATGEFNAPGCKDFWTWSVLSVIAMLMLVLLLFMMRLIRQSHRERKAIREHNLWLAAQAEVADAETIKQHLWDGDAKYDVAMTQEEIAAAISSRIRPNPQS